MTNPVAVISWWIRKSVSLQAYTSRLDSGWMQKVFSNSPEWTHLPLLLTYGVFRPFLPAAVVVGSHAPIWRWITIWRAIGWAFLLPLLIYAPLLAYRQIRDRGFTLVFSLIVWLGIIVASLRGGGDMWDNPRYRATFAALQVALAAFAFVEQRRTSDPWLRRALIGLFAIVIWFVPWYMRRYYGFVWPVEDLFRTLGIGISSAFLLVLWDWAREPIRRHS
jgi:hypothetical protein